MSYHGFPIYTQSQDLCNATTCPVKKGPLTIKLEEPFPVITPPVCSLHYTCVWASTSFSLSARCLLLFCLDYS